LEVVGSAAVEIMQGSLEYSPADYDPKNKSS
jgi:hypothetical protein